MNTLCPSLQAKNSSQRNPLMEAANTSALRISKSILEKVKEEPSTLNKILTMKCNQKLLAINHAIRSSHKNSERCAKIIISYYGDDSDAEQIFLPCLQLGDLKLAQKLWNRTKGDDALQKRMMDSEVCWHVLPTMTRNSGADFVFVEQDKDGYNCFLLVC